MSVGDLRDRPYDSESLLVALNRELVPKVREIIRALNSVLGPMAVANLIASGSIGDFLRIANVAGVKTAVWQSLVELAALSSAGGLDGDVVTRVAGVAAWATPRSGGTITSPGRHATTFSPVGLWQGNQSLTDSSGHGFTLTANGGSISYASTFPAFWGFRFNNGVNLARAANDALLTITGALTIEALIFLPDGVATTQTIVAFNDSSVSGTGSTNCLYRLNILNDCTIEYQAENGSGPSTYATTFSSVSVPVGRVFHLAFTRSASSGGTQTVKLYIDGVLTDTVAGATTPTGGTAARLAVGDKYANGDGQPLSNGAVLTSLKIIGAELAAADVKSEYNATLGLTYGTI